MWGGREASTLSRGDARIRVLWCIKCLGFGGAERLLVSAAQVADTARFAYEAAYVLPSKRALVPELEAAGVPVHCLGVSDHNLDLRWAANLRRLLLAGRYDVVHFHLPTTAAVGRLVARSLPGGIRPATLTTEHNVWRSYPLVVRALTAVTQPLDSAVMAVSNVVRDGMAARHRPGVEVVTHGVRLVSSEQRRAWRREVRAELGVADDEVLLGTVANLRAAKGYDVLLAAAQRLLHSEPSARFAAVGVGPLEAEVGATHRRLHLGDRFLLLGGRADALRIIAGFDVFVLASRFEGLPVAVMEALSLGVPVVATRVGGVPDLVAHGREGLLVPPDDPGALAAALAELVADGPRRAGMASAAAVRGAQLDITHAVRRAEAIYEELSASR